MRPFVSRFTFLLGLLLVLTGVALNLEAKSNLSLTLVLVGLIMTFASLYVQRKLKSEEVDETYPEPDPKDFEEDEEDTSSIKEQEKK